VGLLSYEEKKGDDDDDEVYSWSHAGLSSSSGGVTGTWASFLKHSVTSQPQQKGTSDGLIWTGADLNKPRMGRLLPAQPTSSLSIGRTSATRAPPPPLPVSVAPQLTRGVSTSSTTTALASTLSRASSLLGTPTRLSAMAASHRSIPAAQDSLNNNDQQTFSNSNNSEIDPGTTSSGENEGGGDQGGGNGGGGDGLNSDTGSSNSFSDAAADNSTRHYTSRKLIISSLTYHVSSASLLLKPTLSRLPPALALAISCGVDLLPGSACGFGARGAQSLLAAACVEGGGILLPTSDDSNNGGFGKTGGASSGGASSSAGGIATLKNALFASAAARAPYIHFAVAVSQPFMAIPAMCLSESYSNEKHNALLSSFSSSSTSLPMSSPAWLVACCVEGTNGKWSKIPLPIAPQVFSQSIKAAAASFSSRAAATATEAEDEEIKVQPLSNSAPIVCQAAFASRTWSGASVILFFTGVLTPLNEKYSSYTGAGDKQTQQSQVTIETSTFKLLPQPCIWQVSLQVRSDDARVRAALAVDMPSLVHEWFCGRVSVLSHGQEPSAESLLGRSDLFQPAQAKGANDAVSFAITAMQDRSASLHAKIAAEIPVIFNASSATSSTVSTSGSIGGGGGGGGGSGGRATVPDTSPAARTCSRQKVIAPHLWPAKEYGEVWKVSGLEVLFGDK